MRRVQERTVASTDVLSAISPDAFAGKTILVTGANGGRGMKLVEAFVAAGARQILAASRGAVSWPRAAVSGIVLDVCNEQQIDAIATAHMRDIDILINNAGLNRNSRFLNIDAESARHEMEINYFGTLRMIRAFAPAMRERGSGTIVNIISSGAYASFPNMGSYCASKAALHMLTQSVRAELGYHGVSVVAVYPPAIDTRMSTQVPAEHKMSPERVAEELLAGLRDEREDIHIGMAADFYERVRREPKAVEAMLKARVAPRD
jgi:NAD(P)-dependent dehydrogenase (short-subunit alcohol dehydrogenase family)